jgi:hypothetical protein
VTIVNFSNKAVNRWRAVALNYHLMVNRLAGQLSRFGVKPPGLAHKSYLNSEIYYEQRYFQAKEKQKASQEG